MNDGLDSRTWAPGEWADAAPDLQGMGSHSFTKQFDKGINAFWERRGVKKVDRSLRASITMEAKAGKGEAAARKVEHAKNSSWGGSPGAPTEPLQTKGAGRKPRIRRRRLILKHAVL